MDATCPIGGGASGLAAERPSFNNSMQRTALRAAADAER
jgi:hypothetical protein